MQSLAPRVRTWFRRRRWVVGAVIVAVVVTGTVFVINSGGLSLERVLTGHYDGPPPESGAGRQALIASDREDTVYYAWPRPGVGVVVAAFRAGTAEPVWTTTIDQAVRSDLAYAPGIVLLNSSCGSPCRTAIALDAETGRQLWASEAATGGLIASADRYLVRNLLGTDGNLTYVAGAVGLDARTGAELWTIRHDGRGRITPVPGTAQLLYYQNQRSLSRIDMATGKPVDTADLSAIVPAVNSAELTVRGDAVLLLAESGEPVDSTLEGLVFGLDDLALRWRQPGRTTALTPGLFYSGSREHGRRVLDAGGGELWRPADEVQVSSTEATWGYLTDIADTKAEQDQYTYVDLASGRELGSDSHDRLFSEPGGILQVVGDADATSLRLRYLQLPSAEDADLGTIEAFRTTCDHARGLIACFDSTGHPGLWQYR